MESELFPRKPPTPAENDTAEVPWTPRPQSAADTYTSFRRFREAAQTEQRARTGEMPALGGLPPDQSLPRPGAPLFGPHGMVSRPVAIPPAAKPAPRARREHVERIDIAVVAEETATATRVTTSITVQEVDAIAVPFVLPATTTATVPRPQPRPLNLPWLPKIAWLPPSYRLRAFYGIVAVIVLVTFVAVPLVSVFAKKNTPPPHYVYSATSFHPGPIYLPATVDVDHPPPVLWAESAFLLDESNGNVLYAKNPDERLPMASTTKLMTAVVAMAHAKPETIITISQEATTIDCTCMGLKTGEQYTLEEMLYGMLMPSGNDAAVAIADGVAGNVPTFVGWMNATATALGMTNSHFVNPNGLPSDAEPAYSSAHDLAVLGRYALSVQGIQEVSGARTYTIPATAHHAGHALTNLHEPLWWYPGADGGKPGWTSEAQFVDVLSAVRDGHHIIGVIMHSANDWVTDIRNLLNWGFDDFSWVSPRDIDQQHWIPFDDSYQHFAWDVPSRVVQVGDQRYFPYTGYTVSGAFLTYFSAQNGLPTFGFPRGMPVPGANGVMTQRFDNATIQCVVATGQCQTIGN